ncbi:MAG: ComF family protein [Porphyromonas sp.]|nr:ComF family protein [Porphyromonas sp.]
MSWATTKRIGAFLTDLIFPRTCAICRVRLAEREHCVCMECATKLPRHAPTFVHAEERLLGSPLIRSLSAPFIYQHANPTYDLIIALKYRGYGEVADFVVRTALTEGQLVPQPGDIDLILPVPIEGTRLEARGYNQAALLGEALARHYGVPCSEGYLLRHRGSHSQTALDP